MNTTEAATESHIIDWDSYTPSPVMQDIVSRLNHYTLNELLDQTPPAKMHKSRRVTFDYRIYSRYAPGDIDIVYVLINGFAERASSADSGIKNLIADMLLEKTDARKHAVLVIGGLYSFPTPTRNELLKRGSGALSIIAEEVESILHTTFSGLKRVSVGGYSLGGVLAPLVARAIATTGNLTVEQVCCGEPNYVEVSTTRLELLKRVSRATAYRNDQISATAIAPYIAVKKLPDTRLAMLAYRAKQFQPLIRRSLSMRLVVRDLALQARDFPVESGDIQVEGALRYLAGEGIHINLLHADFSPLCQKKSFTELADRLHEYAGKRLTVIRVEGTKADHGIEEQRVLSTPFLVAPDTYWSPGH